MNKLYKHQREIVDLNPKKHLLAWQCGVGKTLAAIKLAEKNIGKGKALVICPKSLTNNWQQEINKFSDKPKQFIILTKENFRKMCQDIPCHNVIIIDECTYFAGMKSQMSKALVGYIKKHSPEYIYLLSATPCTNTPWSIYRLAQILGRKWNYVSYKNKFFNDIRMGHRIIPVMKKGIAPEIGRLVKTLGSTVKLSSCIDVPDSIYQQEYFELTKEQKAGIEGLEASVPIAYWCKCHQIMGGTLKSQSAVLPDKYFKSEKLARVKDLCIEHDKLAIVCRYNAEIDLIARTLNKDKSFTKSIYTIQGNTQDKDKVVDAVNRADKCIVLLNGACSEGFNMPGIPIMVFYSYDFALKNYIQMKGRCQRINKPQKIVYISMIIKGTIDEDIYKTIVIEKQDFITAIYSETAK